MFFAGDGGGRIMGAEVKQTILNRLIGGIDTLSPRLRLAAKYIVDNQSAFGMDPIRTSADKAGVSANTFVRLADRLGFDGFDDLREPFRVSLLERYDGSAGEAWLDDLSHKGAFAADHARTLRNEMDIVKQSLRLLTPQKAEAAAALLTEARNAYVTATRSSYALAYYFHYVARMSLPHVHLIPRHMGSPVDEMVSVGPSDVLMAITFPPYSADTIDALRLARRSGMKVILLSDSELIAPAIQSDLFLKVSVQSLHSFSCYAGAMAVLDSLLHHIVTRGGKAAELRISRYQSLREDFGAYWRAKLPRLRRK